MPTYYAQAAGAIQSVVWDTVPTGGGSTLTWPPGVGDVLVANGKALTWVAEAVPALTCARLTTAAEGGTAGGNFALSGSTAVAVIADIVAGSSICVTSTHTGKGADKVAVTGNLTGGLKDRYGWRQSGVGDLAVTGNITGGGGRDSYGLDVIAASTVAVVGDITGGTADRGGMRQSAGYLTVTGTIRGMSNNYSLGLTVANCTVLITGDAIGGSGGSAYGVQAGSGAVVTMNGTATGGSGSAGIATVHPTAVVTVNGNAVGGTGSLGFGVQANASPVTIIGSLVNSAAASAVAGKVYWQPASVAHYWQVAWNGSNNQRYTIPPVQGNVRNGVNYGYYGEALNDGTLVLPAITDVKLGVGYGEDGTEYDGQLVAGGVPLIGPGGLIT